MYIGLLIAAGVLLILGITFLLIGIGFARNRRKKEERCTAAAIGTVVEVVKRRTSNGNGRHSSVWYPVFEYYAGGRKIVKESSTGSAPPKYDVGQNVEIYYNPENYEEYYVAGDRILKLLSTVFTAVGVLLLVLMAVTAVSGFVLLRYVL